MMCVTKGMPFTINVGPGEKMTLNKNPKPCPFCGASFDRKNVKKHYIGEVFDEYRCSCGMKSPLLRCGGFLLDWWNRRASDTAKQQTPAPSPDQS